MTFKADWETLRKHAAPPLPWDKYSPTADICHVNSNLPPGTLVLSSLHEFGNVTEPEGTTSDGKALVNALVAQNNGVVRYMTSFGEDEFAIILRDKLYDARNNPKPGVGDPREDAPVRAIVVKSAWLDITDSPGVPHPFFTQRAVVRGLQSDDCQMRLVGLVGLHVAWKTLASPQWVWASFEHVDNVRDGATPGPRTFHDATERSP